MVRYEVTATGPKGYQVTAKISGWQDAIVDDFCSEVAAEEFATAMRHIDADPSHAAWHLVGEVEQASGQETLISGSRGSGMAARAD